MLESATELAPAERRRAVPAHLTFAHYLGAITTVVFLCEAVTGILLMVYYRPSAAAAFHSTAVISDEVRLGWLIRALHQWGADALVLLVALHMMRVYFARAYTPPRYVNWVVGVALLVLVMAMGFTGTLLPWDQYAYWYIDSARQTIAGIPGFGDLLLGLFWGGWDLGEEVLLRFYAFHVGVLPALACVLLGIHVLLVWRSGLQEPGGAAARRRPPIPFFPDFAATTFMLMLLVLGLLLSLAVAFPPVLSGQADPLVPFPHPLPPWYLLPVRELLRGLPGGLAAAAVLVFAALIVLGPTIDRRRDPGRGAVLLQRAIGLLCIAAWLLLTAHGYLR